MTTSSQAATSAKTGRNHVARESALSPIREHCRLAQDAGRPRVGVGGDPVEAVHGLGFEELDLAGVPEDRGARLGDGDGIRPPDEDLAEAGLEGPDALTRRRGSDPKDECGPFDGAFVDGGGEGADMLDVHEAILHQVQINLLFFTWRAS